MKKRLLNITDNMFSVIQGEKTLSFNPFVKYLTNRIQEETTIKAIFYKQVLAQFQQQEGLQNEIPVTHIDQYNTLMELVYACLLPITADETEFYWGLCPPLSPIILYGTDSLYTLLTDKDGTSPNASFFSKTPETYRTEDLQRVYNLILKRLYGFDAPAKNEIFNACINPETGLYNYYKINIDARFVEISAKGTLPALDIRKLYAQLNERDGYTMLENILPLDRFRFSGFSIFTITDVTEEQAIENIKNSRFTHSHENEIAHYQQVIQSLKMLVKNNRIEFELFPFVRVNNKLVYVYDKGSPGLLNSIWGEKRLTPDRFHNEAQGYSANARSFFSKNINNETENNSIITLFKPAGVSSLALNPIFLNSQPVGVLGMYTRGTETFDERTLAIVEKATPVLALLLQTYIDGFNLELQNVVKEKFTSLQSAVQWKFNEVAWHYLYNKKKTPTSIETEPVSFKDVYPVYGAIDIRNSTRERNRAVQADLLNQLTLLSETLMAVKDHHASALLEEMIFKCKKWTTLIADNALNTNNEANLNIFLTHEASAFLTHLRQTDPARKQYVDRYFEAVDENHGEIFRNRREFEQSMHSINAAINQYLESENKTIQHAYPCYFEKFKTDGIEYDIYIGQSIAPEIPFQYFHIKNVRLWQLKSMAAITRLTRSLLPTMPKALHTTQLIFAHNKTIDISFRIDERRFDVEGAYNIRYQMIKKRIDKVHIRNTDERLTQPGKIALVYFNKNDVEDYLEFIAYLQELKVLDNNLEELDLEDLQGVNGLKAIRIGVV